MHFGIIEINQEGVLSTKTGVVSRRGVYLDADEVWRDASSLEVIFLIAATPETVIHEVRLPAPLKGRTLENALEFELESLLPIPLDQVYWGYRKLARDDQHFRLFAVRRAVVDRLLTAVGDAQLGCDCFVPSQWFGPLAADESPMTPLLQYLPRDSGGKGLFFPVDAVPPEYKPVRHRRWKRLYRLMLALTVVAALAVLYNRLDRFLRDYNTLDHYLELLRSDLRESAAHKEALISGKAIAQKLSENKIGSAAILPILADLTARLPEYMWLSNYTQNGEMIELTIISEKDDQNLPRTLGETKLYQVLNLSKTTRPDNLATTFTVKLWSLLP